MTDYHNGQWEASFCTPSSKHRTTQLTTDSGISILWLECLLFQGAHIWARSWSFGLKV